MRTIKIAMIVTYDGSSFDGWQDNLNNLSIEGLLKKAFFNLLRKQVMLDAASRTDKGVHALRQVVVASLEDCSIPLSKLPHAINSQLPQTIRVLEVIQVPEAFHPSLSAKKKTYQYRIDQNPVQIPYYQNTHWHVPYFLDLDKMQAALQYFIGQKDFSSFSNSQDKQSVNPICNLEDLTLTQCEGNFLHIHLTADRFLYKMCRIIVGTLIDIGKGKINAEDVSQIFEKKTRVSAGLTAPSCGLFLKTLNYPDFAILSPKQ